MKKWIKIAGYLAMAVGFVAEMVMHSLDTKQMNLEISEEVAKAVAKAVGK